MDTSGRGELDFEEFVTLMQKQSQYFDESDEDQVLKAFKSFDDVKSLCMNSDIFCHN